MYDFLLICSHIAGVYIYSTMKLYHDFAINLSRKSREINCLTVSGYYPDNRLVKLQLNIWIYPLSVKIIDIRTNPT